jgi:hypothetical protein
MSIISPTPTYHSQRDTLSPLNRKGLRVESNAQAHVLVGDDAFVSDFSTCLPLEMLPDGHVSMPLDMPDAIASTTGSPSSFGTMSLLTLLDLSLWHKLDSDPFNPANNQNEGLLGGMALPLAKLDSDSHAVRMKQAEIEQKDKQTTKAYLLAVNSYEKWWGMYQDGLRTSDPGYTVTPAFPVTAAKVAIFLDYETTRPKVRVIALSSYNFNAHLRALTPQCKQGSAKTIPNSTVGKQAISQRINALENWRLNHHHLYKDNHEAQISLCFDNRIQWIESAAKHNEPK